MLKAPRSQPGDLDVWHVRIDHVRPRADWLQPRERQRLERLRVAGKRRQFLAAQTALRQVLAGYLGLDGAEVRFAYGEQGKPYLPDRPDLGFNLSHSHELAVIAVAPGTQVGVDVEFRGRRRPFQRLARRYFAPPEAAVLAALGEADGPSAFYDMWVLKEAYLKAIGTGLTFAPRRFVVDAAARPPRLISSEAEPPARTAQWRLAYLRLHPHYSAAVCWRGGERAICYRATEGRRR